MNPVDALVGWSVRHRVAVLVLTFVGILIGVRALTTVVFDAFPDLTNVQVQVLTGSPGLASEEVELLVTLPVERALGGLPGVHEVRSLSRPGVSAVTVVFEDGTDPWRARQMVTERISVAREEIPAGAGNPELGPMTTGLGEVWQFTLASDDMDLPQLYRVFQKDVAPRLRGVPGVVEVNAWGGSAPQLDVVLDPYRLAAHGLTWTEVRDAVSGALAITSGGDVSGNAERIGVRAVSNPIDPDALGQIVLRHDDAHGAVRLADVADVREAGALTLGLGTAEGEGEVLFAMVQLLAGADARTVVGAVRERAEAVRASLPPGVRLEPIYDREKLVAATLETVTHSLVEGGLLVVLVLLVMLGDLRAGLLVASVIPLAMLGAFTGLAAIGGSGNLMSLGAIDFGLVVDGTIVVVESIVAMEVGRLTREEGVVRRTQAVSRPVLFGVGILMLVYTPVLAMIGTEGKLFRPMAITVLFALMTALVLSFTYVPAMATWLVRPTGHHTTRLMAALTERYRPLLDAFLRRPALAVAVALALVAVGGGLGTQLGVEFVPRLEEGDLTLQTARLPSISVDEARREALRVERVVRSFPEVIRVASRTGSPAVATDPMGLDEADVMISLKPKSEWTTASTTEGLVDAIEKKLRAEAPGSGLNFTQPIEMRFNELLEGITSDVGVEIHGEDLSALLALAHETAQRLEKVPGAADVKAPSTEGIPVSDLVVRPDALARTGVRSEDVHGLLAGVQRGTPVGTVKRGPFRDDVVLKTERPVGVELVDVPVVAPDGAVVTVGDVADENVVVQPAFVRRQGGSRRVIVQVNVRGRDLGGFIGDAQAAVADLKLPPGTWITWSGKYEQLRDAATRTMITVPTVLVLILLVLRKAFGAWRPAWLIFLDVPAAASGGVIALLVRDLPVSMSAVVGFIALFGVAVMNGIVLVGRMRELHHTHDSVEAARLGAMERFRPVLMTAFVAGIGFLPMAIATGAGAEVQRPLATVVIGGLLTATPMTLAVLPALYARWLREPPAKDAPDVTDDDEQTWAVAGE